jgi:hypothetical protein
MKSRSISDIRKEIGMLDSDELISLCLKLAKFSTANKELLSYLLFYPGLEARFIEEIKAEIDFCFEELNSKNGYLAKKTIRKILRLIKKYAHYTSSKAMEIDLRIHFCRKFKAYSLLKIRDIALQNIYQRELIKIENIIKLLHEDLQYDYTEELKMISFD